MKKNFKIVLNSSELKTVIPVKSILGVNEASEKTIIHLNFDRWQITSTDNIVLESPIEMEFFRLHAEKKFYAIIDKANSAPGRRGTVKLTVAIKGENIVCSFSSLIGTPALIELSGNLLRSEEKSKVPAVKESEIQSAKDSIQLTTTRTIVKDPVTNKAVGIKFRTETRLQGGDVILQDEQIVPNSEISDTYFRRELEHTLLKNTEEFVENFIKAKLILDRKMFTGTDEEFVSHFSKIYHLVEV